MDVYLPADFHAIHDTLPDDWRDVSSDHRIEKSVSSSIDSPNDCADPSWRVF